MKRILFLLALLLSGAVNAQTFPVQNITVNGNYLQTGGTFTATGLVPLSALIPQAANTVIANATGALASPTAVPIANCGTATALGWVSGTGFTCNTLTFTALGTGAVARTYPSKLADRVSPMDYGAIGDGVTNDTTAMQNAIAAAAGKTLDVSGHFYCITGLTINVPIRIVGGEASFQTAPQKGGFKACSTNQNLLTFAAGSDGSEMDDVDIVANAAGQNAGGYMLIVQSSHNMFLHDSIYEPCNGILEEGNNNKYDHILISGFAGTSNGSCGGMTFGNGATQSLDARVTDSLIALAGANTGGGTGTYGFGMLFVNAGGDYIVNNDILFTNIGTWINPGANQIVQWLFFSNTVFGDSTYGAGLSINTQASTAVVEGINSQGSWTGNSGCWAAYGSCGGGAYQNADGIDIFNSGSGTIDGVRIASQRTMSPGGSGLNVDASGGKNIQLVNSLLCGNSNATPNASPAVFLQLGSSISIEGNRISGACAGTSTTIPSAVQILGATVTGPVQIQGNDLTGPATPINISSAFSTSQSGIVIANNAGVDDVIPTIASAATITLPANPDIYLTGTTQVRTINGGWSGRRIHIHSASGDTWAVGGNLNSSGTWTANGDSSAAFVAGGWMVSP